MLAVLPCVLLLSIPARAELTEKDLQIAARSLAFITGRSISELHICIIYSPDVPASKKEADSLMEQFASNFTAGRVTLIPVQPTEVKVTDFDALQDRDVAFVTEGLAQSYPVISAAAAKHKIVTVTSDLDCVTSANCVMGIESSPRVHVVINRAAAQRSSIEFAPGFRMLITEL